MLLGGGGSVQSEERGGAPMAVPGCVATVRPHTMPGAARCARSIVSVQSAAGAQSASRKQITYAPWRRVHAMPALRATAGPELAARRSSTSCRRADTQCVTTVYEAQKHSIIYSATPVLQGFAKLVCTGR